MDLGVGKSRKSGQVNGRTVACFRQLEALFISGSFYHKIGLPGFQSFDVLPAVIVVNDFITVLKMMFRFKGNGFISIGDIIRGIKFEQIEFFQAGCCIVYQGDIHGL